ncbi:hypothetical protein DFH29DRAFT_875459 [Suillus ampliporus]|nr:hypothetical protein DFH29DRAFT_875459 [Suillus ampliporus]
MHSSYHPQSYSVDSERTSPAQADKATLQRQYRAKESDALAQLQKLLRDISRGADTPQTRLEIIVQATETIRHLYRRNTEYREPPHAEPAHSAAVSNSHTAQVQHPFEWQWYNDHADERHQSTEHPPMTNSADGWNPPMMQGCPTFVNDVPMSGDRFFRH